MSHVSSIGDPRNPVMTMDQTEFTGAAGPVALADSLGLTLETLAADAGNDELQGLQDVCLLLIDTLNEWLADGLDQRMEGLGLLAAWSALESAYRNQPEAAVAEIVDFLKRPELELPLGEDEFDLLRTALTDDAAKLSIKAEKLPDGCSRGIAGHLQCLEDMVNRAGEVGLTAWQDACLLIIDALNERVGEAVDGDLCTLLTDWDQVASAYSLREAGAVTAAMALLRNPLIKLPLSEDEFATVEELLSAEVGIEDQGPATAPQSTTANDLYSQIGPLLAFSPDRRSHGLSPLPKKTRELVELLLLQTDMIAANLAAAAQLEGEGRAESLEELREHLTRFAAAAGTVGFAGLADACEPVIASVEKVLGQPAAELDGLLVLTAQWLTGVCGYLLDFTDPLAAERLQLLTCSPQWPAALSADAGERLLKQLAAITTDQWHDDAPARDAVATAADVSLALPADVNLELLDILLQELPGHTRQFAEAIGRLERGGNQQDLELAQRIAHTLKGSANTVGVRGIAVLTHHLEDILLVCTESQSRPGPALLQVLREASDCLEAMSEALLARNEAPFDAQRILQGVLDWANRIDREGLPSDDETPVSLPTELGVHQPTTEEPASEPKAPATSSATVRVSKELVANLFRLSGESIIVNSQAEERLRRLKAQLQAMQAQFEQLQRLGAELETLIDLRDFSGRRRVAAESGFDALEMDQYNELHTTGRRMVEAALDFRELSLDAGNEAVHMEALLEYQKNLAIDMQGVAMETKLVGVSSIASRLERSVRQTCRLTGKAAELTVIGGQLMIDGDALSGLLDPLMHLLRNAVDHGIEAEADRLAVNKPKTGQIAVEFELEGQQVLVRCRDDGRGLDLVAIRETAEKRGLLEPGQVIDDDALQALILRPNFSTRTQTTQTSGRGVGMDMVRAQVLALGGSLKIQSQAGVGLTVEMRVPLPMSRTHALVASVGLHRVVIGNKGFNQVFYAGAGELHDTPQGPQLLLDDEFYPGVRLNDLLRMPGPKSDEGAHGAILLVRGENGDVAVLVDAVIDSRDVVIMNMGHYIPKIPGVMGATILGDGTVSPVINVAELVSGAAELESRSGGDWEPEASAESSSSLPSVLIVDDSLSNRRALEQLLRDAGFQVQTAEDGISAAEALAKSLPDIVLTDLEMPRMNGIELTSHLRLQAETRGLPVIMITSRTTQRHRLLAEQAGVDFYLTKPVREQDLLEKIHSLLHSPAGREARA